MQKDCLNSPTVTLAPVPGISSTFTSEMWDQGLRILRDQFDPHIFSAFIEPLRLNTFDRDKAELTLAAPSNLILRRVNESYRDKITNVISTMLGFDGLNLRLLVDSNQQGSGQSPYIVVKKLPVAVSREQLAQSLEPKRPHNLDTKYTFASFVVGNNNQFCHAAAMRVAENPGQQYNPLFIYGGVGLGKTHLLHSIGNAALAANPEARVLYLSSETFTNDLIQSLRTGTMNEFKNKMRNIDVLLIDDIQFMCGKERTQEEFFHTFNTIYAAKHQIVITSDKLPQEISGLEERLQTRFSWGLTADLQAPDFETRVAILKRKAGIEGFHLDDSVAQLIAEKVSSNVRELEGALTRIHAYASLQDKQITMELAVSALLPLTSVRNIRVSITDIKRVVSEHYSIKVPDLSSKRRTRNLSFPRHICMYLCRKHTTASYPEIGGQFGGRDHSSVIHATQVVSTKLKSDPEIRSQIADIEKKLFSQ